MTGDVTVLTLSEYAPAWFPATQITLDDGERLWRAYDNRIHVESPSFATRNQWILTAQGWVGYLPVSPTLHLRLLPKVPLHTLFGMWEYAYRLNTFEWQSGLMQSASLQDFYAQLARVLAHMVLQRGRRGYQRAYVPHAEQLPYLRGQIAWPELLRTPWNPHIPCRYEEHTADIADNQLLAWTLFVIARSGLCPPDVHAVVRRAYHELHSLVTVEPHHARECVGRVYHRLNHDYRPLHALCRFFLENSGPTHETGGRDMVPFLVDMAALFELFVAEWLQKHLPAGFTMRAQERVAITAHMHFAIDLVLYDEHTGRALCVLDTKYKAPEHPSSADFAQVVTYAHSLHCTEAVLIYPTRLAFPLDHTVGNIRVRSLTFALDGALEQAGQQFLADLGLLALCGASHLPIAVDLGGPARAEPPQQDHP